MSKLVRSLRLTDTSGKAHNVSSLDPIEFVPKTFFEADPWCPSQVCPRLAGVGPGSAYVTALCIGVVDGEGTAAEP